MVELPAISVIVIILCIWLAFGTIFLSTKYSTKIFSLGWLILGGPLLWVILLVFFANLAWWAIQDHFNDGRNIDLTE